ncbi:hypothetical protein MMC30_001738 [Trapelia coarctata]|nr:hypothetical protein [Trapelia coarctata]
MEVGVATLFSCIQKLIPQRCSNPTPVTSPESESKSSKPGFHFPYSYEDEDSDDSSREASVEILDHPLHRTTTLPQEPASKSAEVEVLSSQTVPQGREKPRVVYDLTETTSTKAQSRNPDRDYLGSSQDHPIDLEPERPVTQSELNDDSDDEPPEVLPTGQASLKAMPNTRPYDPFRYYAPIVAPVPPATEGVVAVPKAKEDNATEPMVADSDADGTDNEIGYNSSDDEIGPNSDIDSPYTSEKSWSSDVSDEEQVAEANKPACHLAKSPEDEDASMAETAAKPKVHFAADPVESIVESIVQEARVLVEDSQLRDPSRMRSSMAGILDVSAATVNEPKEGKAVPETQWSKPAPRAPSPSDAALAKPPQTTSQPTGEANSDQMCSTFTKAPIVSAWCRLKNHGAADAETNPAQWARHNNHGHKEAENIHLQWVPQWQDTTTRTQAFMDANLNCIVTEMDAADRALDRALTRYDDGPFSGWPYDTAPHNPYNSSYYPHKDGTQPVSFHRDPTGSVSFRISSDTDSGMNDSDTPRAPTSQPAQPSTASDDAYVLEQVALAERLAEQDYEQIMLEHDQMMSQVEKMMLETNKVMLQHDTSHKKPAKLPISDIVNQVHDTVTDRPLKRKADDMATDELEDVAPPEESLHGTATVHDSEDSLLPDAQPREDLAMPDNTLQETVEQPEPISKVSTTASVSEEPPRKKAKTSRGASRPVKAFVSGVVVGCLSLAGACAAFIAAIPENVRDEALREM